MYLVNCTYYDEHSGDPDTTILSVFVEKKKIIYLFIYDNLQCTVPSSSCPGHFVLHFFPLIFDKRTNEKTETNK